MATEAPTRVCVIGAGPCGLALGNAFMAAKRSGAAIPEVVVYEKQDDWSGLWNYTWRTGLDQYGEPVHGSMYRYLWSNGPKECLEMADYTFDEHFKQPIPSFPPREVLHNYITGRAKAAGFRDWIRFATVVRNVEFNDATKQFTVAVEDLRSHTLSSSTFSHVVVATGHFSVPNVPYFEGVEAFPGRVLHSHDFRSADEFTGKNVLIIGSSYSAEDIGLQCFKYGAASVTISYRTAPMGFGWPDKIEERPLVTRFEGKVAHFSDGTSKEVDAVLMCTGYQHSFPFLPDALKLRTTNRFYPPGLFKGVVSEANNQLFFLGMQDQFLTFSMFDVQAFTARDYIMGRQALPAKVEQQRHSETWLAGESDAGADPHKQIDYQIAYAKHLHAETDYPKIDWDLIADEFKEWEHDKEESILGYRDKPFKSPVTGTMATVHHTTWLTAMDDSMACFMGSKL